MKKNFEFDKITADEIIKIFKEEEKIELTIAEAELIVEFLKMLSIITIKRFLEQ